MFEQNRDCGQLMWAELPALESRSQVTWGPDEAGFSMNPVAQDDCPREKRSACVQKRVPFAMKRSKVIVLI